MRSPGPSRRALHVALIALAALLAAACADSRPRVPQGFGNVIPPGHKVPSTPLVNQDGQPVTLGTFRGKYVVLAQFLTLCQDECPITTAAFQIMQRSVQRAGLGGKVVFIEATVDPDRDNVTRLHAYRQRFGADWTLLTGTEPDVAALWKHFGVYYQKVPEADPEARDWLTGQPLAYDVDHTNGFILVDPAGNERFITTSLPFLHGKIPPQLRGLLDDLGVQHLDHGIDGNNFTIPQAMAAVSWLVGRNIALVTS